MKTKNLFALLLIVCMLLTVFAACGDKNKPSDSKPSDSPGTVSAPVSSGDDDGDDEVEISEINVWLVDLGNTGSAAKYDIVEAALNELSIREAAVSVNYTWVNIADLGTQFTLAMSNNEQVDVVVCSPVPAGSFLTYYTNGMTLNIAPYLDENAPELRAMMDELNLLDAFTMPDGGIYGISAYRQLSTNLYLCYRTDVLEAAGVLDFYKGVSTWSEFAEVLQAITDLGETYAIGGGKSLQNLGYYYGEENFSDAYVFDVLGDTTGMILTDNNGNASLLYTDEGMVNEFKMFAGWGAKGYVFPDTAFSDDLPESLIGQKRYAGYIIPSEYGIEVNKSQTCGTDMTCVEITKGALSTSSCQKFSVMVPSTSADPEAALRWLNLAYTSSEFMNLINWGVEGETYVINENGEADYPAGTDASTCGYHYADFVFGNQFATLPWTGSGGSDFRERARADFLSADVSPYMGLTIDTSDYSSLVAAIVSVRDEYVPQVTSGSYTDAMYSEFISKLEAAGVNDYVALYQTAIDEFMA